MYCKNCGKEVDEKAVVCPHCGVQLKELKVENSNRDDYGVDTGSIGWGFLGFFFPIVGLILFLIWKDIKPKTAKMAGKGALISVIVEFVVGIVFGILTSVGIISTAWLLS